MLASRYPGLHLYGVVGQSRCRHSLFASHFSKRRCLLNLAVKAFL